MFSKIKKFFTKTVYYEEVSEQVDLSKRSLLKKIGIGAIVTGTLLANSNPVAAMTFNSKVKQQHDMQINGVSGWKLKSDGKVYLNKGVGVNEIKTSISSSPDNNSLLTEKEIKDQIDSIDTSGDFDGGFANSVFLTAHAIDGGSA